LKFREQPAPSTRETKNGISRQNAREATARGRGEEVRILMCGFRSADEEGDDSCQMQEKRHKLNEQYVSQRLC